MERLTGGMGLLNHDGNESARFEDPLAVLAKTIAPKLDFQTWLGHLAARGMFSA
jgi:hypothetical protein